MRPGNIWNNYHPGGRSRTFRRRCFGEVHSATPFRRRDVLATAVSAMGCFGDRRFGDRTFRRPPVRRWDVLATGRFGDGRFGDQSSTVYLCVKLKRQKIKLFVSLATLGQKKMIWQGGELLIKINCTKKVFILYFYADINHRGHWDFYGVRSFFAKKL